ncbi:uncharacterized protein BDV17DRAFT_191653 [Aspergillus undulatus]|uniref:uncharacterized protein n=1 Tax=Aspergillus undulatus TaxID=1810928 RepID=UPI003CCDED61
MRQSVGLYLLGVSSVCPHGLPKSGTSAVVTAVTAHFSQAARLSRPPNVRHCPGFSHPTPPDYLSNTVSNRGMEWVALWIFASWEDKQSNLTDKLEDIRSWSLFTVQSGPTTPRHQHPPGPCCFVPSRLRYLVYRSSFFPLCSHRSSLALLTSAATFPLHP